MTSVSTTTAFHELSQTSQFPVEDLTVHQTIALAELLGENATEVIGLAKLERGVKKKIQDVVEVFLEIQRNLSCHLGASLFSCRNWIQASQGSFPELSEQSIFVFLKTRSYQVLLYPQKGRLIGWSPPMIQEAERRREQGVQEINRLLSATIPEEDEKDSEELLLKRTCLTQTLWGRAVCGSGKKAITYADALVQWGGVTQNTAAVSKVFKATRFSHWMLPSRKTWAVPTQIIQVSYTHFLVEDTLRFFQEIFGTLPSSLWTKLYNECSKSDTTRSNLYYFSNLDRNFFYRLDFGEVFADNQDMCFFFSGLQVFLFLKQNYEVSLERLPSLLALCMGLRNASQFPEELAALSFNRRGNIGAISGLKENLEEAFEALEQIAEGVLKRGKSFFRGFNLAEDAEAFLSSPRALHLFLFLVLKKNARKEFGAWFSPFQTYHSMQISAAQIHDFCVLNATLFSQSGWSETLWKLLTPLIETLQKSYPERTSLGWLFFTPSLDLRDARQWDSLGKAPETIGQFSFLLASYEEIVSKESDRDFFALLRQFFLRSRPISFLMSILSRIGGSKISFSLLRKGFLHAEKYKGKVESSEQELEELDQIIAPLSSDFSLSPWSSFLLYLKGINWSEQKEPFFVAVVTGRLVVNQLQSFCPEFPEPLLLYLLSHPNQAALESVQTLTRFWKKWAYSTDTLRRLFLSEQHIEGVFHVVDLLLSPAVTNAPASSSKEMISLFTIVKRAFFPVWQPLSDLFFSMKIGQDQQIFWEGDHVQTHVGRLFFETPNSRRGIYLHWETEGIGWRFWILSADLKNKTATGGSLVWMKRNKVSAETVFSFFSKVSEVLFSDTLPSLGLVSPNAFLDDSDDEAWKQGAPLMLNSISSLLLSLPEEVQDKAWQFLYTVKRLYKSIFFPEAISLPKPDRFIFEIAGDGRIYETRWGASLVPEEFLSVPARWPHGARKMVHTDLLQVCCLVEKVEGSLIETCCKLFSQATEDFSPLDFSLKVTEDGGLVQELPVSFKVEEVPESDFYRVFLRVDSGGKAPMASSSEEALLKMSSEATSVTLCLQYNRNFSQERFSQFLWIHFAWLKSRFYHQKWRL